MSYLTLTKLESEFLTTDSNITQQSRQTTECIYDLESIINKFYLAF